MVRHGLPVIALWAVMGVSVPLSHTTTFHRQRTGEPLARNGCDLNVVDEQILTSPDQDPLHVGQAVTFDVSENSGTEQKPLVPIGYGSDRCTIVR